MPQYLRHPHLARDLITFTAQDDVWLASLSEAADSHGTRAWRLTADRAPVLHPRLNPSATHVAWTSTRDGTRSLHRGAPREAYAVPTGGGPGRRRPLPAPADHAIAAELDRKIEAPRKS